MKTPARLQMLIDEGLIDGVLQQLKSGEAAEVDALFHLAAAGVRVPKPFLFFEGVLLMELMADADGHAAPRLSDGPAQTRPGAVDLSVVLRQIEDARLEADERDLRRGAAS